MAPKRKAPASAAAVKPRASRQRGAKAAAAAAASSDGAASAPVKAKTGRARQAPKASAPKAAAAAVPKKAAAPKRGAKTKTKATGGAGSSAATPAPSAATAPVAAPANGTRPVDEFCGTTGIEVVGDFDVMLNQSNIGVNANKFYKLQMLVQTGAGGQYTVWTRWGRVGLAGQSKMLGPFAAEDGALREFKSKFQAKAGAAWEDRDGIEHKVGKYVPVEVDPDAQPTPAKAAKSPAKKTVKYKSSALDAATQDLISLILDDAMFTSAMKEFEIDVERFPLGQLSKAQVAKGQSVLQELKDALRRRVPGSEMAALTSKFYTTIPHAFGMRQPPVLTTIQAINAKVEMCNVLSDIEIAQSMMENREESELEEEQEQEHLSDEKYRLLMADLQLLSASDAELPVIKNYIQATAGGSAASLAHVWRVKREGEADRFAAHDDIANRRLLWHGTNVAVVAAVLKTGLRIMPHSGGRVGKGIYLASEHSKSAGYTRCGKLKGKSIGVMFLVEAALGKEHSVVKDDHTLVAPPKGHDSVVARGRWEPDSRRDASIKLDGNPVIVPQGPPVPQPKYVQSYFDQSEYLLYQESQVALRYCITFDFSKRGY